MNIGLLALQGAFAEHIEVLHRLDTETTEVRLPKDLKDIDGLIIPGGESTTILKLMRIYDLINPLKEKARDGFPVWGTCAGMICLAKRVFNSQESTLEPLELMDIDVKRNAFGRQVDSFEIELPMAVLGDEPFHAVFIRAPLISQAGPGVEILARLLNGTIVAAQQNNLLVTSFHPELTGDLRLHEYFLKMASCPK